MRTDIIASYYLNIFRPKFFNFCKYIGVLSIYIIISLLLSETLTGDPYGKESTIIIIFVSLVFIGFSLDIWAKESIISYQIKRHLEDIPDSEIIKITDTIEQKNIINYPMLDSFIIEIINKLNEEGYLSSKYLDENEETDEIEKIKRKVKDSVWNRYKRINK